LLAVLALPLVLIALGAGLAAAQISGSSVALLAGGAWTEDPGLLAGEPRPIRSDEYLLATPIQVGNVAKGGPASTWVGLTDTELAATSVGAPTWNWALAFQPQNWGLAVLPVEVGFAARWWMVFAVGIVGVYALLMALRPRIVVAVPLALAVGLSPLAAWWTAPPPGPIVGYLAGAGAAVILAVRATTTLRRVALGLVAGYLGAAAFFVLYPPWQVSVGIVVAAVVVGEIVRQRPPLRAALIPIASAAVVAGGAVALWAIQTADAIAAITGTYYPGNRVSAAGQADASILFSAPLNAVFAADPEYVADRPMLNQSEVSAPWFPLPVVVALLILVVLGVLAARRSSISISSASGTDPHGADLGGWRSWATIGAAAAALLLLLAWMFAPLPAFVGQITLLERVQGNRAGVAVGLVTVVLVHLCAGRINLASRAPIALITGIAVALCAPLVLWSASGVVADGAPGVPWAVATGLLVGACVATLAIARGTGLKASAGVVLAVLVVGNWAIVNPVYRGLGPLTESGLARELAELADTEGPARIAVLGAPPVRSVVASSPHTSLSGLTYYPTREVWERLAPDQERQWNNYVKYTWVHDPEQNPARIVADRGTDMTLRIDLCSPEVDFLDVDYVIASVSEELPPCYTSVSTADLGGREYVVARRG
jgi:hypothetical protein